MAGSACQECDCRYVGRDIPSPEKVDAPCKVASYSLNASHHESIGIRQRRQSLSFLRVFNRTSPRPANSSYFSARSSPAEKPVAAIRLKAGNVGSLGHVDLLKNIPGVRIDPAQIALLAFPGGVPEFSIQPADAGDEAVGLDGAKNWTGLGIDLMYIPVSVLPHPQSPFSPRQA